ncbi:MAG TPA: 30S ribosomal protein S4 [Candidatus Dormibacteraeota bacterium]|jgi:small subunit ribosomal protein S4|nr:30S ribosomal protein S4 [Candidatus Dormibacteraeota bacterium]
MAPRRSVEKLSRRAGVELGLKGARQAAGKSGRVRRPNPPGQHGRRRSRRESDYLQQLKEKQKLQWFYGVPAGQLRRYYVASSRRAAATGEELLRELEERLDNVVYRLGFAGTRAQARQFVVHGHVDVNGQRVDRPAYQVRANDQIAIGDSSAVEPLVREAIALGFHVPEWLTVDREALTGRVLHAPARDQIDVPADENRAVEFFAKY